MYQNTSRSSIILNVNAKQNAGTVSSHLERVARNGEPIEIENTAIYFNIKMPCSEKFEIVSHQYGSLSLKNHREMLDGGKGMTVLSIDLNQDEDEIIIEEELPGYTRFAFAVNWTVVSKL